MPSRLGQQRPRYLLSEALRDFGAFAICLEVRRGSFAAAEGIYHGSGQAVSVGSSLRFVRALSSKIVTRAVLVFSVVADLSQGQLVVVYIFVGSCNTRVMCPLSACLAWRFFGICVKLRICRE